MVQEIIDDVIKDMNIRADKLDLDDFRLWLKVNTNMSPEYIEMLVKDRIIAKKYGSKL